MDNKALELAKRWVHTSSNARARDDGGHIGRQVTPRGIEHQSIDELVEGNEAKVGDDHEEATHDREDRGDALGDLNGTQLGIRKTHGDWCFSN